MPLPGLWLQRLSRIALALSTVAVAACSTVVLSGLNLASPRVGIAAERGLVFDVDHQLEVDVYRPVGGAGAAVVVFLHGGSWESGSRGGYRWLGEALARQGVVAMLPDYRKYPQVRMAGFLTDAARAVAWAKANAVKHGGNPDRVFVMGHSAGGYIALMLGSDARWLAAEHLQPTALAGVISLAGPSDFLPLSNRNQIAIFGSEDAEQRRSQPINFVDGDEPPMLLLHGDADRTVLPRNATTMADAIKRHGGSATVVLYPDVGHVAILLSMAPAFKGKTTALADSLRFIREQPSVAAGL